MHRSLIFTKKNILQFEIFKLGKSMIFAFKSFAIQRDQVHLVNGRLLWELNVEILF